MWRRLHNLWPMERKCEFMDKKLDNEAHHILFVKDQYLLGTKKVLKNVMAKVKSQKKKFSNQSVFQE